MLEGDYMPNRQAKQRKMDKRKKNNDLKINGRTASQIIRTKKRNENRKVKQDERRRKYGT